MPGFISMMVQPICCASDGARRCMTSSENVRKEGLHVDNQCRRTAKVRTDDVCTRLPGTGYSYDRLRPRMVGKSRSCRTHRIFAALEQSKERNDVPYPMTMRWVEICRNIKA